jgi:hypothetical protein
MVLQRSETRLHVQGYPLKIASMHCRSLYSFFSDSNVISSSQNFDLDGESQAYLGNGVFGSGTPRNLHNGFQPCLASKTSNRSDGTFDFTSSIHWLKNFSDLSGPAITEENTLSLNPGGTSQVKSFASCF